MKKLMIKPQWQQLITAESAKPYFTELLTEIKQQRLAGVTIFPNDDDMFNAFKSVDLSEVKVVILGQDPYHGEQNDIAQAHGLAFSVQNGIKIPPSLANIYKELTTDIVGFKAPQHGCLTSWAEQGVLLLNTVLSVQQANAHSHAKLGWEMFTDAVIEKISQENEHCVFILWGTHAKKKGRNIDNSKHLILTGPHPSPLSSYRGFFGCQHFSKANQWLQQQGVRAIDWTIL